MESRTYSLAKYGLVEEIEHSSPSASDSENSKNGEKDFHVGDLLPFPSVPLSLCPSVSDREAPASGLCAVEVLREIRRRRRGVREVRVVHYHKPESVMLKKLSSLHPIGFDTYEMRPSLRRNT